MPDRIFKDFWNIISKLKRGNYDDVPDFFKSSIVNWLLLVLLVSVISLIITMSLQHIPSYLQEGMISQRGIKADKNYEIVDQEATKKFKDEATASILPIYDIDPALSKAIEDRVGLAFANVRLRYEAMMEMKKNGKLTPTVSAEESEELRKIFSDSLGVSPDDEQWNLLFSNDFPVDMENYLSRVIDIALSKPVVAERGALDAEGTKGIIIRKTC